MTDQENNPPIQFNQRLAVIFEEILPAFVRSGIKYWVFGGVGIAGVVGKFIRENQDVDVYVLDEDKERVENLLKKLCEIHGSWDGDKWSLSYSILKTAQRWKFDICIKGIKKFSVTPVYKVDGGIEFRAVEVKKLSNQALTQELREIDGYQFFSPPKSIIIQLLWFLAERYIQLFKENSKHLIDARALLTREEVEELGRSLRAKIKMMAAAKELKENPPQKSRLVLTKRPSKINPVIPEEFYTLNRLAPNTPDKTVKFFFESGRPQTIEQYLSAHQSRGRERIKEKLRLAGLRLRRIKNPERLLGLINYLEKNSRPEQPLRLKMNLAKKISELLNLQTDPIQMLELLRSVGYLPDQNNFFQDFDRWKEFLTYPVSTIKTISQHNLFGIFEAYADTPQIQNFIVLNSEEIAALPAERIKDYLDIFDKIDNSLSSEIKYFKSPLVAQLLGSSRPAEDYRRIETVFMERDIPLFMKIFRVFKILNNPERLKQKINQWTSPFLQTAGEKRRYDTIYQDLFKIHLRSGNRSLREYLKTQPASGELLEEMGAAKTSADKRNRKTVDEAKIKFSDSRVILSLEAGDFLQGIKIQDLKNILQNGSIAKEFLGESFDFTIAPFSTDVSLVKPENLTDGIRSAVQASLFNQAGEIFLVLKDRGQFQLTTAGESIPSSPAKIELFPIGFLGDQHYGVRTGFPATEIDFIITKDNSVLPPAQELKQLFFEIAENGYYLPITDESGTVIFTPEMYDEYRAAFRGLEKFAGQELIFQPTIAGEKSFDQLAEIIAKLTENNEYIKRITQVISEEIKKILSKLGVSLRPEFEADLLDAELLDIGSTNRRTNTPENFDIDLSLRLAAPDFARVAELAQGLKSIIASAKDYFYQETDGYYQLRFKGLTSIGGKKIEPPLDLDIGFSSRSVLNVYRTHDAIGDKLNYIKNHYGQSAYEQTLANIILTKQILKAGSTYKRGKHGGFGGGGVENWLLANGGKMENAFKNFKEAAYENGQRLTFKDFQAKYRILNPGRDHLLHVHENFIEVLHANGYETMLNIIENYLNHSN